MTSIQDLIETVHRLRAPGGCPWDRAQTFQSLRPHVIEEAYEVVDVLDQIHSVEDLKSEKTRYAFREELGDLLMQVVLHSEMANETGAFDLFEVAKALNEKLIRRHPHVFGENKAENADQALKNWEKAKAKEKADRPHSANASVLEGVPRGLPSLQKATRVIEKVTKVGFQWAELNGPLQKVEEELSELKSEVLELERTASNPNSELRQRVESELGDLFFSMCNVAFLLKINPEDALRSTLRKFEKRFRYVERRLQDKGITPEQSDLKEMDQYWDEAKKHENVEIWGLTGGVASGKSSVARIFTEAGIPVINADKIAKELSESDGPAHNPILKRFGTTDRTKLREIIFSDPQAQKDLENILHPLIQTESSKRIRDLSAKHSVIIYEAALLIEAGRHRDFDGLVVVVAPEETRKSRLVSRDKISSELASKMISAQLKDEDRTKYADYIIENSGDLTTLTEAVQALITKKGWSKRP